MARLSAAAWLRYLLWMAVGKHSHSRGPRAGTSPSGWSSGGLRARGTNAALKGGGEAGDADPYCPAVVGALCPLICGPKEGASTWWLGGEGRETVHTHLILPFHRLPHLLWLWDLAQL